MKRPLKSNHRKKVLNRQHHKITSRRLSHFNLTFAAASEVQHASTPNQ